MTNRLKLTALFMLSGFCMIANATSNSVMVPTIKAVENIERALSEVKAKSPLPVIFPTQVPAPAAGKKYYAYWTLRADGDYVISVDSTADCHGAKYCSLGTMMAQLGNRPQIYFSANDRDITQVINLSKNKKGYYTPAHAEADYWPTMIEWRMGKVLYSLSWTLKQKNEKQDILDLVNSALVITPQPRGV
jgi:hypothetical protein